ncbi:MAG: hypothetical protein KBC33_02040 [Candidatus Pacebacteria bacterium]|nr:hypothetical protein [Candidatus Paceibacterota bacterium]
MKNIYIVTPAETRMGHLPHLAVLTKRGIWQASRVATTLETSFDLVLHAPIAGASQTAHLIAGAESPQSEEVPELRCAENDEAGRDVVTAQRLLGGFAPPQEYFLRGLEEPLRALAGVATSSIDNLTTSRNARWTLIIADPLIAPLVAQSIAGEHHSPKRFIQRNLGPCQGYLLRSTNGNGFMSVTEIE